MEWQPNYSIKCSDWNSYPLPHKSPVSLPQKSPCWKSSLEGALFRWCCVTTKLLHDRAATWNSYPLPQKSPVSLPQKSPIERALFPWYGVTTKLLQERAASWNSYSFPQKSPVSLPQKSHFWKSHVQESCAIISNSQKIKRFMNIKRVMCHQRTFSSHTHAHTHTTHVYDSIQYCICNLLRPWYRGSRMNTLWKRKLGHCTDLKWLIYFGGLAGVCHDEAAFAAYLQNRKKMRPADKLYVCIHTCTHARIYTRWHRYWCIDIHVYMCRWAFHVYERIPVCIYVRILVYIYRYWSIDIGVSIYRWASFHIMNTHTVYVSRHLYS